MGCRYQHFSHQMLGHDPKTHYAIKRSPISVKVHYLEGKELSQQTNELILGYNVQMGRV